MQTFCKVENQSKIIEADSIKFSKNKWSNFLNCYSKMSPNILKIRKKDLGIFLKIEFYKSEYPNYLARVF